MSTATERAAAMELRPTDRVAIIAGDGELPRQIVRSLVAAGQSPFVIIVADDREGLVECEHAIIRLEEYGRVVSLLRGARATHVVMAGGVSRRPRLRSIRFSLGLIRFLPRLLPALGRGDDALLRAIVSHIETEGFKVIGSHDLLPDLLAPRGTLTRTKPSSAAEKAISAAWEAARAIGALDIGQAAVAVGRRVVALEGVEGTAAMLARVRDLRASGRISVAGGVLVKCAKPGQELRADLPTIGPDTVAEAHAAGLSGIAVEAGRTIILQQQDLLDQADRLGIFILGVDGTAS